MLKSGSVSELVGPVLAQEGVAVLDLGGEAELPHDVVDGVAVVVDVQRVLHVVAEVVEVGPASRLLQGDPVPHQGDRVRACRG